MSKELMAVRFRNDIFECLNGYSTKISAQMMYKYR